MLRNLLIIATLLTGYGYALEAEAIPPIKSQLAIGEEAESIKVTFDRNKRSGTARVEGCIRCPLTLNIDEQTQFFENGKPISRPKAETLSGDSGTIIFENERVTKIRW